eukprot:468219-Prymnesium_polylepis.1
MRSPPVGEPLLAFHAFEKARWRASGSERLATCERGWVLSVGWVCLGGGVAGPHSTSSTTLSIGEVT